jgi:polysaccharide chain length determinant protein (PEP-CTERM system associated)
MSEIEPRSFLVPRREILDYLEVPLRRPRLVLIPVVLGVLGALGATFMVPKEYKSSTLILVESEKIPDSFMPKMTTETSKQRLFTLKQEILSRTRLETVIHELNPYPNARGRPLSKLVEDMRDAITVNVKGADAFLVEYVHRDPATAMAVANRLVTLFIEEATRARESQVEGAYDFIESQLVEARRQLEANEEALRIHKERHLGTLPEQLGANLSTLQRLQLEQQSLNDSIRAAEDRQNALQKTTTEQARAGDLAPGLDPSAEMAQLQGQLAALRARYTEEHPDVKALLGRIVRLEEALPPPPPKGTDPPPDTHRSPLQQQSRELHVLKTKREELEGRIASFQARVEQTPKTEQELATLNRDSKNLRDNYQVLLNKKLEAQQAEKLEKRWKGEHFKTLDPAHLPERAFFPSRSLFLAGGLLLGLALGLGLAFSVEVLDHSLKNIAELEAVVPYPVLASIPHIPSRGSARR